MEFQSQLTKIISKVEEYHHGFLAARVMQSLNGFVIARLAAEGRFLSLEQKQEFQRKIESAQASESMAELDMYLLSYEQMIKKLVDLNPGELEFTASSELQKVAGENEELKKTLRDRHPHDMGERGIEEEPKEKGKLLPFKSEGRH